MEFKGNLPSAEPSQSDWEWVKKQIAEDAPIPYDASDPDDGPYDPNDDEAVERFLTEANRVHPSKVDGAKKTAKSA
jgi:hypothetical protein